MYQVGRIIRPLLVRLSLMAVVWLLLSDFSSESWIVGAPVVLLAAATSLWLASPTLTRIHWRYTPVFFIYLLTEMARGGVITAGLAFGMGKGLRPGLVTVPLRISGTPARVFLANVLNLVPGTLSVEINDRSVRLHVLDLSAAVIADTRRLEERVAELFGEERN